MPRQPRARKKKKTLATGWIVKDWIISYSTKPSMMQLNAATIKQRFNHRLIENDDLINWRIAIFPKGNSKNHNEQISILCFPIIRKNTISHISIQCQLSLKEINKTEIKRRILTHDRSAIMFSKFAKWSNIMKYNVLTIIFKFKISNIIYYTDVTAIQTTPQVCLQPQYEKIRKNMKIIATNNSGFDLSVLPQIYFQYFDYNIRSDIPGTYKLLELVRYFNEYFDVEALERYGSGIYLQSKLYRGNNDNDLQQQQHYIPDDPNATQQPYLPNDPNNTQQQQQYIPNDPHDPYLFNDDQYYDDQQPHVNPTQHPHKLNKNKNKSDKKYKKYRETTPHVSVNCIQNSSLLQNKYGVLLTENESQKKEINKLILFNNKLEKKLFNNKLENTKLKNELRKLKETEKKQDPNHPIEGIITNNYNIDPCKLKFEYWLCKIVRLPQYLSLFQENEYDDITMIAFFDENVIQNELNINKICHFKLIYQRVNEFKLMIKEFEKILEMNKDLKSFKQKLMQNGILTIKDLKADLKTKTNVIDILDLNNDSRINIILHFVNSL